MKLRIKHLFGLILLSRLLLPCLALSAAPIRVIEPSAIPYSAFLSKAEFDLRFPGEQHKDPNSIQSGWYVVYKHESLTYYFGPTALHSIGRDSTNQLREIIERAVKERPSITNYSLELIKIPRVVPVSDPVSGTENSENTTPFSLWQIFKKLLFW